MFVDSQSLRDMKSLLILVNVGIAKLSKLEKSLSKEGFKPGEDT